METSIGSKIKFIKALRVFVLEREGVTMGLKECKDYADLVWVNKHSAEREKFKLSINVAIQAGLTEAELQYELEIACRPNHETF